MTSPDRFPLWQRRNGNPSPAPGHREGETIKGTGDREIDLEEREHFLPRPCIPKEDLGTRKPRSPSSP